MNRTLSNRVSIRTPETPVSLIRLTKTPVPVARGLANLSAGNVNKNDLAIQTYCVQHQNAGLSCFVNHKKMLQM